MLLLPIARFLHEISPVVWPPRAAFHSQDEPDSAKDSPQNIFFAGESFSGSQTSGGERR
jgi:hypothetical protein